MQLENKVAVITGGSTGIGGASALLYARAGAKVVIGDINVADGEHTAATIESEGGMARFVRTDVTVKDEVAELISVADEAFGRLDVLVTAAGVLRGPGMRVDEFEDGIFDDVIDVNLKGTFLAVKHATPLMERSGGGVMLCIASGAGVRGGSSSVAYGSSKGAVHGFVLTVGPQLASLNIRMHTICPGGIATPLKLGQIAESARQSGQDPDGAVERARRSLGDPMGVAKVLTFLASNDADYIRGTIDTR